MSDQILLHGMAFEGLHGVSDDERSEAQVIEVDLVADVDLRAAGTSDDLERTVDYAQLFEICRMHVEQRSYRLLEAIGEHIATDVLSGFGAVSRVAVTVRKPGVPLDGVIEHAGVRVTRSR